jgi:hypothetical protein
MTEQIKHFDSNLAMENYLKTEHRKVYADWVHKTVKILNSTSPQVLKQGVYELPNGDVYVVKLNKAKTHLYAKQLVDFKGKPTSNTFMLQVQLIKSFQNTE